MKIKTWIGADAIVWLVKVWPATPIQFGKCRIFFIKIGRGSQQHDLTKNGGLLSINSLVIHEKMDVFLFQASSHLVCI